MVLVISMCFKITKLSRMPFTVTMEEKLKNCAKSDNQIPDKIKQQRFAYSLKFSSFQVIKNYKPKNLTSSAVYMSSSVGTPMFKTNFKISESFNFNLTFDNFNYKKELFFVFFWNTINFILFTITSKKKQKIKTVVF